MVTSPSSPPGAQRQHPSKRWWQSKAIGGPSRTVLRPKKRVRTRSQREQILAWVASPRFPGDARLRHDGGDPPSRQSVSAKKNETPNCKYNTLATPPLIRWSIQEVRRPPSDSLESGFNPRTSSHGHSGVELTRRSLSARTSKQNDNCNARDCPTGTLGRLRVQQSGGPTDLGRAMWPASRHRHRW